MITRVVGPSGYALNTCEVFVATFTQNAGRAQGCAGRSEMPLGRSGPGLKTETPIPEEIPQRLKFFKQI